MTEPRDTTPDDVDSDCNDEPKLTAEEWAAVEALSAAEPEQAD